MRRRKLLRLSRKDVTEILADHAWRERYERLGVDVTQLLNNLTLSPEDRIKRHANALAMALAFKKAGEEARRK
ncbi:MAG TPA: hypothetical protein VEJ63_12490 [Planctomycetota bacterium]|nr:hypothetical protein [Planctomycetota bacterium]